MNRRKTLGFTLIELMIAVLVIAILAAIAYPSYQNQVRKARMSQAQADMLELAQFMERCFVANNTYVGCALPFTASPRTGGAPFYVIGLVGAPTRQGFVLRAVPQATGGQSQFKCMNLELNQSGVRSFSGAGGSPSECW